MRFTTRKTFIYLLLTVVLFSCEKKKPQIPDNKFDQTDSSSAEMIRLNQLLVEVEQNEIKSYIDTCSHKFNYIESGVWMVKTTEGNGQILQKNDIVEIEYQVETLLGKICYTYTDKLKKQLVVGKVEKQRGFNIALTQLKEGDQAIFIIPSNLAFGAMGDTKEIPPRATLIYRIFTIKNIEK